MAWRWAAASVIGTAHLRTARRLQDAYAVSAVGRDCLFAIVSDGAGSAEFGAYGAWLACRFFTVRFREWLREDPGIPSDEELSTWISELRSCIESVAQRRATTSRQFAATLAAVLISPDGVLALQIGDSVVVGRRSEREEWDVLCWPENGEYASTTYFVTDEGTPRLNIFRFPGVYDAFALFSDGVGDLALSHLEQAAHARFFDPMMRPVDGAPGTGRLAELSKMLAEYLASPSLCERTDDDKTLILISGI